MNKEHRDFLHTTYPLTFKHKVGFECGDGWFELLAELCTKLESLQEITGIQIEVQQIKEKFGTLRFYYSLIIPDDVTRKIDWDYIIRQNIILAETKSEKTCEECGKLGVLRSKNNWLRVSCDEHNK